MDNKTWSQRLKDGETIKDIVLSEPTKDINSWIAKCNAEGLSDEGQTRFINCADHFNRISFQTLTPGQFTEQWKRTVNI